MIEFPQLDTLGPDSKEGMDQYTSHVLQDLWVCLVSREASLMGRKEVLGGKAKFGILGDGKELPQVALARFFEKGDFRSGYYRDQTIIFALGLSTVEQFFAQLYADPENDPFSGGRQMNNHPATAFIDENDNFLDLANRYNISSDISSTAGQMGRALGLALASNKFKNIPELSEFPHLSSGGREVTHVTIGDASTSEGIFWEAINAATVSRIPMIVSVWDDGYGISVPKEIQTTKGSISKALEGFLLDEHGEGLLIYTVKAWDYPALINVYNRAIENVRRDSRPALIHVQEVTQPQGHSTSGSHERYKTEDRLKWEVNNDCIEKMIDWILETSIASEDLIEEMRLKAREFTKEAKNRAWKAFNDPIKERVKIAKNIYSNINVDLEQVAELKSDLALSVNISLADYIDNVRKMIACLKSNRIEVPQHLINEVESSKSKAFEDYHTNLYSEAETGALNIPVVPPVFSDGSKQINGYEVLNKFFEIIFDEDPRLVAFGEDLGFIGGVNQGFANLQEKFGTERIFDSGIREWSIMGAATGLAMRGLKPIAEAQYLDYLIYGLSPLSDDLATVRYRSDGIQMAPAIIRTRGHRLEGIWHAGSPLGMLINSLRGMYICVPRNMVQAAGMYNTLRKSTDPGLVIEVLNSYRRKELCPDNLSEFTVPLGSPEILQEGEDITIVSYGVCVRLAHSLESQFKEAGISAEIIDVQTLLPFDLEHVIVESIKKTNRVLFVDEDVPGGASAYMMQKVLEEQQAYKYLDSQPSTVTAYDHRTPFGSEGDYFTKPQAQDIYDKVISIMKEADLNNFGHL